jgi:hypothetical protein
MEETSSSGRGVVRARFFRSFSAVSFLIFSLVSGRYVPAEVPMDVPRSFLLPTLSLSSALPIFSFFLSYFFLFRFFLQNFKIFVDSSRLEVPKFGVRSKRKCERITTLHIDTDEFVTYFNL